MFLRRRSVHGRLMGDIRSAQQKCVRRAFLEPLILLQLEHLLSTPDMSLAALKRLVVIAAEDKCAPKIFAKRTKKNVPINILIMQWIVVVILSCLFLLFKYVIINFICFTMTISNNYIA